MSDFPVIHTERLTLRKPTFDDVKPLFELAQDDEVMLFYGMEPFKEEKQSREEIDWFLKIWKEGTGTRWVITLKGQEDFIGEIGFFEYENKAQEGRDRVQAIKGVLEEGVHVRGARGDA